MTPDCPPVGATPGPDERPTNGTDRALCAECGETIYQHANAPWLHVETGLVWCYRDQAHPEVAVPPPARVYAKCKDCGEDLKLRHYCGDLLGAVAAVRALHWPSPDRDPTCDCYDGLQDCPTIAALDRAGCP